MAVRLSNERIGRPQSCRMKFTAYFLAIRTRADRADGMRGARMRFPRRSIKALELTVRSPDELDEEKIDRTVLALLYLTLHGENRLEVPRLGRDKPAA